MSTKSSSKPARPSGYSYYHINGNFAPKFDRIIETLDKQDGNVVKTKMYKLGSDSPALFCSNEELFIRSDNGRYLQWKFFESMTSLLSSKVALLVCKGFSQGSYVRVYAVIKPFVDEAKYKFATDRLDAARGPDILAAPKCCVHRPIDFAELENKRVLCSTVATRFIPPDRRLRDTFFLQEPTGRTFAPDDEDYDIPLVESLVDCFPWDKANEDGLSDTGLFAQKTKPSGTPGREDHVSKRKPPRDFGADRDRLERLEKSPESLGHYCDSYRPKRRCDRDND